MKPKIHYYPDNVTAYRANKLSSWILFALARHHEQAIRSFDISLAVTHQMYDPSHKGYVKLVQVTDGTYFNPNYHYCILQINYSGSKAACKIHGTNLHIHLAKLNYGNCNADKWKYLKKVPYGKIIISITRNALVVIARTKNDIDNFLNIFKKYTQQRIWAKLNNSFVDL